MIYLRVPFISRHEAGEECWGSTLGQIFNRAWCEEEVIDCKPNDLMFEEYLKTDILTLLSYIAIGVISHDMSVFSSNKWYTPERYNANDKSFVLRALATKIEFERRETNADKGHSILIAHVTGEFNHSFDDTTAHLKPASLPKADMERILSGYPPYYRSEYVLRHRLPPGTREIILQNPIPSPQDRFRGGWIVAVGRTYAYPVAFYVDSQRHRPGVNFPHTIDASITRVRDILEHDIIPVFSPSDPLYGDVCAALEAVKRLMGGKTRSDLNRYWPKNGSVRGCISSLDQEVSNALIRLFNRFGPLTEEEKVLVKGPNTMAVLEVVVDGVATVVEYFKDRAVWLPSWWVDELKNESIYLRGCNSTEQAF
ncbi:hypothetical protein RU639_005463 [Aspergillus parasiticus]